MRSDEMLKRKYYILLSIAGAILCAVVLAISFPKLNIYGQNSSVTGASPTATPSTERQNAAVNKEKTLVKKTVSAAPSFAAKAAAENLAFKDNLLWNFGVREQRGWHLYAALIRHTVETEAAEHQPEFASAVAAWQAKNNLSQTGIVDSETLYEMIEFWQSRRLNSSAYPASEDLLDAPITDFYDSSRAAELLQVERETYRAYKKMVAAAAADLKLKLKKSGELADDEKFLRIISAFRSREYQAKLRAASPQSGRAGLAVNSPHFTGRALDIYVGGEPTITKDFNRAVQIQTPAYRWLVKNAARFGFYPYFYEPWHWEYVPPNLSPTEKNTNAALP